MINGQLRATYLRNRGVRARARRAPAAVQATCREWIRLARWLHRRGITDLAACTDDEWRGYAAERWDDRCGLAHAESALSRLTGLWAFDQQTAHPSGIARPPWDAEGADDFLPSSDPAADAAENATEPLDPHVIGSLLVWAIRLVEDFADDILAAWAENRRLSALAATNPATPVVRAIRVLERIVPDGELLLSGAHHDFTFQRGHHGTLKKHALNLRITDFIAWANHEAHTHGLTEQTIGHDPHGGLAMSRFRRTLAWHVARRPGGLIALAIQYGHMRTVLDVRTSSGYGTRSRHGIHSVLDVETALAAADTAARLRDRIAAGEKISGPAARRALTAATHVPRFEGRIVPRTFAKKAAAYLARDGIVLFDNPDAHLICVFKRGNALCEPAPDASAPKQYDCRPGCGNAVRTDTHAGLLRERADEIDQLAAHAPERIGNRLPTNADRFRATAESHDATAQPAGALA